MNKCIRHIQLHNFMPIPSSKQQSLPMKASFKEVLSAQKMDVIITKHAEQRMLERNIQLSQNTWTKIAVKLMEAKSKGITDALILVDNTALVVNTKENKVITALPQQEAKERIFTNINGTILI